MHRDVIYTRQIQDNELLPRARVLEVKSIHHAQCLYIMRNVSIQFSCHFLLFKLLENSCLCNKAWCHLACSYPDIKRHANETKITSHDTTQIEGSHSDELIVLDNRKKAQNWKIKISLNFQSLKKIKHRYKHYYHQMLVNVL